MKTLVAPLMIMLRMMALRLRGGKLRRRLVGDQSSKRREESSRIGMVRRLL